MDGDRKADYLAVDPSTSSTRMWLNSGPASGGGWLWTPPQGPITSGTSARITYADINGDRRADYLQVNADSSVQAWLNGGLGPAGWYWTPLGTIALGVNVPGSHIRFADVNGDGKADYLAVDGDSSVKGWLNGGQAPGGWYWTPVGTFALGVNVPGDTIRFADLNGDGKADYLAVDGDSSVKGWLNGGQAPGGWYWTPVGTVALGVNVPGTQIRFTPLNGTGKADYLALGDDGSVNVWANYGPATGGGWLWASGGQATRGFGSAGTRIQFADLNGDGRADYLDINPTNGATKAWLNLG
ncbi:VCBS repeat-containing protein [Micromonospora sp. S-DT3-3-22]|uniref:FG-GAP repeat domain-containing protein n=1 Tax=Micromonospora sp. S-DT3-3-22 TaxID=2755359 RepID=UPI002107A222|nr:VCBS repeat-containing protein [Micromonospora sp. S-DT3-3-22]